MAGDSFFGWVVELTVQYWPLFLRGAEVTLVIALSGTMVGFLIGILIGVIRTIPNDHQSGPLRKGFLKTVNFLLLCYIEFFRGTPMMVQAMVIFYGYTALTGSRLDTLLAGFLIVSINTGAYMAEIVRGGILSVDKGQFEAAHSIGMTHSQTMTNIVLPQAVRLILPALSNEFVINIKDTSVLSVISVSELFFMGKSVAGIYFRMFEAYSIVCVVYFVLTFTTTRVLRYLERKLEGPSVYTIHGSQTVPEAEFRIVDRELEN
ncbi:MAG: amino acid ABC transporter permease [Solirubrobacterales bacterium]